MNISEGYHEFSKDDDSGWGAQYHIPTSMLSSEENGFVMSDKLELQASIRMEVK